MSYRGVFLGRTVEDVRYDEKSEILTLTFKGQDGEANLVVAFRFAQDENDRLFSEFFCKFLNKNLNKRKERGISK